MRGFLFACLSLLGLCSLSAQERKDVGVTLGASYYMGDYNQGKPLSSALPGFGVLFRYNLNKMYSLRLSAAYGGLKGAAPRDAYLPLPKPSFSTSVLSADAVMEFNFMKFSTLDPFCDNFSPYLLLGAGCAIANGEVLPHIPFGVGVKYAPGGRITIGAEWRLHKTFTDTIDGYSIPGTKSAVHNNDWFAFLGLFVTYRLFNSKFICPAYR